MLDLFKLNLQLFADGGDGGASTGEGEGNENTGENEELARIPERARETYKKAVAKNKATAAPSQTTTTDTDTEDSPKRITYADLIKSDDYKEEHKAYMDKVIGDRLKGVKSENQKMRDALNIVANKYGLDTTAEDFLDSLSAKVNEDNSFYEDYAMEHNISPEDAKEILTLRQQVKAQENQRRIDEETARNNEWNQLVMSNAEKTRAMYPGFDLNTEWQNEQFKRLVWSTNGDTTAAYRVLHYDELAKAQGLQASQKASQQIAQSVASNMARPIENGLSSQAASVVERDWTKASLADIRKYAEEQRRMR